MMRYLMMIYTPESSMPPAPTEGRKMMESYAIFTQEVRDRGLLEGGEALQPTSTATTVKVRNGERIITDGPFAETREQLGGYYLLNCKDLDEALDYAAKIPGAQFGSIEVRPILEFA
jgi:hypothetical protein